MKPIKFFVVGLISLLFGCDTKNPYQQREGRWYYKEVAVDTDNPTSFTPLNADFAKDEKRAYYHNTPIAESEGASFEALNEHYGKDRRNVYYADTYRKGQEYYAVKHTRIAQLNGADAPSFIYIDQDYAKDKQHVYFEGSPFTVKDVASFWLLAYGYAKDTITAYYLRQPIKGSDSKTFVVLDNHYAKDAAGVYFSTVEVPDNGPGIGVSKRLSTAPSSFTVLDDGYAKSDRAVYYNGKVVDGADPSSFTVNEILGGDSDAKDKNHRFKTGRKTN